MEKLCIVRRRKSEPGIRFSAAEGLVRVASGSRTVPLEASNTISLDWNYPLRGDISTPDDQKLSIELTPTQADVVKSHAYFKLLLGGEADGSSLNIQRAEDGEVTFNFYFKQVYLSKLLTIPDVCGMLQVSKAFLTRMVKQGKLKSYKIGKLRRFSLEDILAHLSESAEAWPKGGNNVL